LACIHTCITTATPGKTPSVFNAACLKVLVLVSAARYSILSSAAQHLLRMYTVYGCCCLRVHLAPSTCAWQTRAEARRPLWHRAGTIVMITMYITHQ
jgi:hypothetical protein